MSQAQSQAPASRWIVGGRFDAALFIATPVMLMPLAGALLQGISPASFNAWAMAFGAQGHHLPGMLRAYGDTELYQRFRTRLLVAPALFFGLSALCITYELQGLELIAYTWGIWHAAMQTYGFLRIYDAKMGAFAPPRARWDFALCASWFLGGAVFSPLRLHYLLHLGTACGLPVPTLGILQALRVTLALAMGASLVGAIAQARRDRRQGIAVNVVKWALASSSIAFWWFVNVVVRHPLLGLPLFELFHDVQYLAIVWQHMRRRLASGAPIRAWLRRTLGRPRLGLFLYVTLVLAYGLLKDPWSDGGMASRLAVGFFIASQLLHFYYDGFIWKVRDPTTRTGLALQTAKSKTRAPATRGHHGAWATAFVATIAALAWGQQQAANDDPLSREARVAALVPDAATAWYALGEVRRERQDPVGAVAAYEQALRRVPDYAQVQERLGFVAVTAADTQLAEQKVAAAKATMTLAQSHLPALATRLSDEGIRLNQGGDRAQAERLLQLAVMADPNLAAAQFNLAVVLWQRGAIASAHAAAAAGLALEPNDQRAQDLMRRIEAAQN